MKRSIAVLCLIGMLVCLFSGCNNANKKKSFTCQELTMQVPQKAKDISQRSEYKDFAFALESSELTIAAAKVSKSDYTREEEMTAETYIRTFQLTRAHKGTVTQRNGYFYYISKLSGTHLGLHMAVGVYENGDDIWCLQLATDMKGLADQELVEYLDSVTFS